MVDAPYLCIIFDDLWLKNRLESFLNNNGHLKKKKKKKEACG